MKQPRSVLTRMVFAILFLVTLFDSNVVFAAWNLIMTENFEGAVNTWTWQMPTNGSNARLWHVRPMQNRDNPPDPHWGIENYIYRVDPSFPERYTQAAWCDASTDPTRSGAGRDPEFDFYRINMNTVMWWGPINASTLHNARSQFEWINRSAPGDTFFWLAGTDTNNPINASWRSRWFQGVKTVPTFDTNHVYLGDSLTHTRHCGAADQTWRLGTLSIDSLDSAGTIISLVGRPQVFFGWRFTSNSISESLLGAFVDNVKIATDDGMFDLSAIRCMALNRRDSSYSQYPQVLDTLIFYHQYSIRGAGMLRDSLGQPVTARIRCTINNAAFWDTLVPVDAGVDQTTRVLYSPAYIPTIEGVYHICWTLDADSSVRESNEANNRCGCAGSSDSLVVIRPNGPPRIAFMNLNDRDTTFLARPYPSHTMYPVVVDIRDDEDAASWYMYISQDSSIGTGVVYEAAIPGFPRTEHDGIDTVWVDVGQLYDGPWYFSVFASDVFNNPVWGRARSCLYLTNSNGGVGDRDNVLPKTTSLYNSYPNPFNGEITFRIGLAEHTEGWLVLHDIMGREVDRMKVPGSNPGWYNVSWRPQKLSSGVYFAKFVANGRAISTVKLMYLK